ncbi:MAG: alpha/beta fold hydrolase [Dermatophilaceae bacterium]
MTNSQQPQDDRDARNPLPGALNALGGVLRGAPTPSQVREQLADAGEFFAETPAAAQEVMGLWMELLKVQVGVSKVEPHPKDPRFKDPAWRENPAYRRLAQGYTAWEQAVNRMGDRLQARDYKHAQAVKFASGIITSALAPTNFLSGNPAALKKVFETGGKSLVAGMKNWADDVVHNQGMPSMAKRDAFTVGKDLAVTPGAVVARDEVGELLQYTATTEQVCERPTLIIPPPIGRYYFLDLAPGRSFIEYAVSQGMQMFLLSWRNPQKEHADWGIETYCESIFRAIEQVKAITGQDQINIMGVCAGGIVQAVALNELAARGDNSVHTAAFLVTLLDWKGDNPMNAFGSDQMVGLARTLSSRKGVFSSQQMGSAFTWMRPNDLVWNYWVNNYLMGQDPPAFDILAWNADGTRLPARLHSQFLDIFQTSPLVKAGARTYGGVPFDGKTVTVPLFVQGAVNDHLTPWKGTYRTTEMLGSTDVTYVLSNAGHIASLVNPPSNPKASFFAGPGAGQVDAQTWRKNALQESGTWWTTWCEWAAARSGEKVPAPSAPGGTDYPVLGEAPGAYVRDLTS